MSRYFQALNRLAAETPPPAPLLPTAVVLSDATQRGRDAGDVVRNGRPSSTQNADPAPPLPRQPLAEPRRGRAQVPNRFTGVLERIQEHRGSLAGTSVVVAPVCSSEAVQRAVAGIAAEAERAGLSTLTMRAVPRDGGLALECCSPPREAQGDGGPSPSESLVSQSSLDAASRDIESWLEKARRSFDFIVITAPAFALTPDTTRLARACDGLVLVAQAHTTERGDLELAAEQARIAKCNVFGVVLAEQRHRLKEILGIA
jgi:hypothetical protein